MNNSARMSGLKCCVIKRETSGMPVNVYSTANVLFNKHRLRSTFYGNCLGEVSAI